MNESASSTFLSAADPELPSVLITLLKGVLYRDGDLKLWTTLLRLRFQAASYMSALGLTLHIDEMEGYAFLRSSIVDAEQEEDAPPRLVARRPLTF